MPATLTQINNLIVLLRQQGLANWGNEQTIRMALVNRETDVTVEIPLHNGETLIAGPGEVILSNYLIDSHAPLVGPAADTWRRATAMGPSTPSAWLDLTAEDVFHPGILVEPIGPNEINSPAPTRRPNFQVAGADRDAFQAALPPGERLASRIRDEQPFPVDITGEHGGFGLVIAVQHAERAPRRPPEEDPFAAILAVANEESPPPPRSRSRGSRALAQDGPVEPPTRPSHDHVLPGLKPSDPPTAWDLLFKEPGEMVSPPKSEKGKKADTGTIEAWDRAYERLYVDLYTIDRAVMNYAKALDAIAEVRLVNLTLTEGSFEVGVLRGKLKSGSGGLAKNAVDRLQALLVGLEYLWRGEHAMAGPYIAKANRRS